MQVDERTINQHGAARSVGKPDEEGKDTLDVVKVMPSHGDLVSRDEIKELKARREYYKNINEETKKSKEHQTKLDICKFIAQKLVPAIILCLTLAKGRGQKEKRKKMEFSK